MHKDAAAKNARDEDDYHYEEPMPLIWFIALTLSCAAGISAAFMALVWIATS